MMTVKVGDNVVLFSLVSFLCHQLSNSVPLGNFALEFTTEGPIKAQIQLEQGVLNGKLGKKLTEVPVKSSVSKNVFGNWEWANGNQLVISHNGEENSCKTVVWSTKNDEDHVEDCFDIEPGTYWYGGSDAEDSIWPLTFKEREEMAEITGGNNNDVNRIHNRYWINSKGVVIRADDDVPLFTYVKNNKLCLVSRSQYPYSQKNLYPFLKVQIKLSYAICVSRDIFDVYRLTMDSFMTPPNSVPSEDMFRSLVWSTSPAIDDNELKSKTLVDFATNISESFHSVSNFLMMIKNWEVCVGIFRFHTLKFGNPQSLFIKLADLNFKTILQILPFYGINCEGYEDSYDENYFVDNEAGSASLIKWQNGTYAFIDFTNDEAVSWWQSNVRRVYEYGIRSFFFDEGQASYLPEGRTFPYEIPEDLQPDIYSKKYVEAASGVGELGITSIGRQSQNYPLFVKMKPLQHDNWEGLQEVIPRVLRLGILGFPFVLPDVVGGSLGLQRKPQTTLYIRWLQVNTLMPSMHFSVGPWEFQDPELDKIIDKMMKLREKYIPLFIVLADEATNNGYPIIRPLWWIDPYEEKAFKCKDQFLIGNDVLVAPVLKDTESRDIYLPTGHWNDTQNGKTYVGPTIVKNYLVDLSTLPVFEKLITPYNS